MANDTFTIDGLVRKMKNEAPEPKADHEETISRREMPRRMPGRGVTRPVGRPKNKRALINKISKTSYFDDGTHQRIKQLQVFSKVEVKDLILVSVIDFLDRNCDENGKLTAAGEQHITSVMDRVYEEYGEYLD